MRITSIGIPFTKKVVVMKLWKDGMLPTVTYGFYNQPLSTNPKSKNVATKEHVKPRSRGGATNNSNIVIATYKMNNGRGDKPLSDVFTKEGADRYYDEFRDVIVEYEEDGKIKTFNGNDYIEGIQEAVYNELEKEGRLDLLG